MAPIACPDCGPFPWGVCGWETSLVCPLVRLDSDGIHAFSLSPRAAVPWRTDGTHFHKLIFGSDLHDVGIGGSVYLFSLLALNLFYYWESRNQEETNWLLRAAIAISAVYTQLVRTIGLAVVLAVLSGLLLSRRFRQLTIVIGLMALAMVPQILLNARTGDFLFSAH